MSRYKRIKDWLEDFKTTLVYLHFVVYLAASLTSFLKMFEKDEPLVHILYDKVNELMRACLRMFLNVGVVREKEGAILVPIDCDKSENWLPRIGHGDWQWNIACVGLMTRNVCGWK